jgi:hypothetical protein
VAAPLSVIVNLHGEHRWHLERWQAVVQVPGNKGR